MNFLLKIEIILATGGDKAQLILGKQQFFISLFHIPLLIKYINYITFFIFIIKIYYS